MDSMDSMDSIEVELKVLIECLKKKEIALGHIANITENQGDLLASSLEQGELYSIFMQMNGEKQGFIEKVIQYDQVFENVLIKIGPTLDEDPTKYAEQVRSLQDLVRKVMDLDVQIRVYEDNNSQILTSELGKIQGSREIQEMMNTDKAENADKPEAIDSGEYGSNKVINAYKSQSKHHKE